MQKLQVFDPPMCCSSGVCGTNVDPKLISFAGDLEWLKKQGIEVERYNLASEPSAFVNNEVVKATLKQEGNDCLPLIVVNNEIVYKSSYPEREKLAELCGISCNKENIPQEPIPAAAGTSNSCCGPECDCHQSSIGNGAKKIVFILVLLIIAGIIAVKTANKANAFSLNFFKKAEKTTEQAKPDKIITIQTASPKLGEYLESMSQLNMTTMKQDAAFIFIPAKNNTTISYETKTAALAAKNTLNNKNITVGLYTLRTTSTDYASLSSQVRPPAILVVCKDKGKSFASGEITQMRLLQAYMAASISGDCGSSCPCR